MGVWRAEVWGAHELMSVGDLQRSSLPSKSRLVSTVLLRTYCTVSSFPLYPYTRTACTCSRGRFSNDRRGIDHRGNKQPPSVQGPGGNLGLVGLSARSVRGVFCSKLPHSLPRLLLPTMSSGRGSDRAPRVKNRAAAAIQITAEQLLREAQERQEDKFTAPRQRVEDFEELNEYRGRKRTEFETRIRYSRTAIRGGSVWALWGSVGGLRGARTCRVDSVCAVGGEPE